MAYRLTEEAVYKLEHMVLSDATSIFECDTDEERANLAIWAEGVRNMTSAVVDAIKELNRK